MSTPIILVERVSARVFCHPTINGGGNPVTVFRPSHPISFQMKQYLAKQCSWESVIVEEEEEKEERNNVSPSLDSPIHDHRSKETPNSRQQQTHLSFFMPNGQEVSYCAHAAIGGAFVVATTNRNRISASAQQQQQHQHAIQSSTTTSQSNESFFFVPNLLPKTIHKVDIVPTRNEACLIMKNVPFEDEPVSDPSLLRSVLQDHCQHVVSNSSSMTQHPNTGPEDHNKSYRMLLPTFRNVSIARPKTIVYIDNVHDLRHTIQPPTQPNSFQTACSSIDDSTGLYLYSMLTDNERPSCDNNNNNGDGGDIDDDPNTSVQQQQQQNTTSYWEARQFPQSSGYREDPATGIAAAALATSLAKYHKRNDLPHHSSSSTSPLQYYIYQGMSMDRPSLIQVCDIRFERNDYSVVSFGLKGTVTIDDVDTIEVENKS